MPLLDDIRRIAEIEFGELIADSQPLGEKLRLFVIDSSYIDVWLARKLPDRFGFHWERRHIDGTLYRYDNFPDINWQHVETYPYHFHNGAQHVVEATSFSTDILIGFRDFMHFVQAKMT
jgi:hypothetical protein